MKMYDESLKRKRDWQSALSTKLAEGMKIGEEQGMKRSSTEIASRMKSENMPVDLIARMTGLSIDEIKNL